MCVFDGNRKEQRTAEFVYGRTTSRSVVGLVLGRFGDHQQHVVVRHFNAPQASGRTGQSARRIGRGDRRPRNRSHGQNQVRYF